jgi:hypothetical protein
VADELWAEIGPLSLSRLYASASCEHRAQEFAETGGGRVETREIESIRVGMLQMSTCPGEAARPEVWGFVTMVVLPDLARWRFPSARKERFIGGVRNTFQRLWWRAHTLTDAETDDPYHLMRRLTEDAQVQIMERTNLSSNLLLARSLAEESVKLRDVLPPSESEAAQRAASKMLLQRMVIVNFDALSSDQLKMAVESIFSRFSRAGSQG